MTVDLCDENGVMQHLLDNPKDYAEKHLQERASFILVKIESKSQRYRELLKRTISLSIYKVKGI